MGDNSHLLARGTVVPKPVFQLKGDTSQSVVIHINDTNYTPISIIETAFSNLYSKQTSHIPFVSLLLYLVSYL